MAVAAGAPLAAATVLQKTVDVEIRADGSLFEHSHLEVRLDAAADLATWSPYPIPFDERRELGTVTAWVRRPDGTSERVGRNGFDTVDIAGKELLLSSGKLRLVRFPGAPVGAVLGLDWELTERPWFPAGWVGLGAHAAEVSRLRVQVRGGGAAWRWSILGRREGLEVREAPGEVTITATDLPSPPDLQRAPDEVRDGPVLRFGWGEPASWAAVGRWYDEISRGLPRHREEVRREARRLLGATGPGRGGTQRGQLEEILAFVRREVRYVAVEVGVGGYRPAPAHETLARRWGDCKGKVALLLDLLDEAGIEAYPALVRASPGGRVDPEFPAPGFFNHMIAALPVTGLTPATDDPVAGGYLFVDPTQTRGGVGWLHPNDQDQWALVLRGERSALVRTPLRPRLEASQLTLDLEVQSDGSAAGRLCLELRGGVAAAQAERLAGEPPEAADAEARRLIAAALPGATASAPRWLPDHDAEVPAVALTATVMVPSLVALGEAAPPGPAGATAGAMAGSGQPAPATSAVRLLALAGPSATPPPGLLRARSEPVLLRPQVAAVTWRLALPAGWCPAQADGSDLDNAAGAFHQSLACSGGRLTVERRTELRQRWVDPEQFSALAELAKAEHRATARRLRLDRLSG